MSVVKEKTYLWSVSREAYFISGKNESYIKLSFAFGH